MGSTAKTGFQRDPSRQASFPSEGRQDYPCSGKEYMAGVQVSHLPLSAYVEKKAVADDISDAL